MTTKYLNLKGKVKWAKVYDPDEYAGASNWKLNLYLDDKEMEKFKQTGLQLKVKEDVDGKYIVLRRPTKKLIRDEIVFFCPPEIRGAIEVHYEDEQGNKIRQYAKGVTPKRVGERVDIGNDSVVLVNFSYYDTSKGKGHRMEGINVLELVEYVKDSSVAKEEPTPPKKEEKPSIDKDLNDDIPW